MRCGNKPSDGGNLILTSEEKEALVEKEPNAAKFLRPYIGAQEFINGDPRWCLWLEGASPDEFRGLPEIMKRVEAVKSFRKESSAAPTRLAAQRPTEFFYRSQPETDYLLIPEASSERRAYVPIGFVSKNVISANTNFLVASNDLYLFGILTSRMHMAWMRQIAGRLKSDYRYSGSMVYNTFPFPLDENAAQKRAVATAAQAVLDVRSKFPSATLADLYDPIAMPPELSRAHSALDRAVERCYRKEPFASERARVEFLFQLYERLTAPLLPLARPQRARRRTR
jgi:hypothetical protein